MDLDHVQVARLYEAAVEPDGLEIMSGLVRHLLDIDSAGFWLIRDARIVEIALTEDIRASEPAYLGRYRTMDPWTDLDPRKFGTVTLASERFDEDQLLETEFYQDFARHFGMLRPMGVTLDLQDGMLASVAANRLAPGPLLQEDDKARMQGLVVHLTAALRLRLRFAALQEVAVIREDALNVLAFPLVICDAEGRVSFANEAARTDVSGPLVLDRGRVFAGREQEQAALRSSLARAALGESTGIAMTGRTGDPVPLTVTPAPDRFSVQPGWILLSLPASRAHDPAATLQAAFGLTPTQTDLCRALARGLTFEQAGSTRGVAVSTMRSHFEQVLVRTGAANLRDLLRLMASLPVVSGRSTIQ